MSGENEENYEKINEQCFIQVNSYDADLNS